MNQALSKTLLMTPGPVPLHPQVQSSLSEPMIHHRTPEFEKILLEAREKLKLIFKTANPCFILSSTGSGGMEALLCNVQKPGAKVLNINSGKFGERWGEMARVYQGQVFEINVPWGETLNLDQFTEVLKSQGPFDICLTQACETSTGLLHPIKQISEIIQAHSPQTLFLVDGITALGATPLPMDEWQIDGLVGGSQKSFMLPTGLSFISLSNRALKAAETNNQPRYYFDIRKELKALKQNQTYFSSNVTYIRSLLVSLNLILDMGLDQLFVKIQNRAEWTRELGLLLRLPIFCQSPSPTLTVFKTPINSEEIRNYLENKYKLICMGGQDQAKGQILRIGHMGYFEINDFIEMSHRLYEAFRDLNLPVPSYEEIKKHQNKLSSLSI